MEYLNKIKSLSYLTLIIIIYSCHDIYIGKYKSKNIINNKWILSEINSDNLSFKLSTKDSCIKMRFIRYSKKNETCETILFGNSTDTNSIYNTQMSYSTVFSGDSISLCNTSSKSKIISKIYNKSIDSKKIVKLISFCVYPRARFYLSNNFDTLSLIENGGENRKVIFIRSNK